MRTIRIEQVGGPEVLETQHMEMPCPGVGQVLIRVAVAGVNYVDIYQRTGLMPVSLPYVPGFEGSGIVRAVGPEVNHLQPGDRVAWVNAPGSYSEYHVIAADQIISLPDEINFEQANLFQAITAQYLLHEYRQVSTGDTVLIHAAAGGVGLLAVQWAKHLGARVIGTVSNERKADIVRAMGADHAINYQREDFVTEVKQLTHGRGADLVLDSVGKATLSGSIEAVAPFGTVLLYGFASGVPAPISLLGVLSKCARVAGGDFPRYVADRESLLKRAQAAMEGMREGWLRTSIFQTLPLARAAEAHRLLESRETVGKLLLTIELNGSDCYNQRRVCICS